MEDFSSIPPQLTFLIKSNSPYYRYTNLLRDLNLADHVVFFGHSINGMDFPYFKDYFWQLVEMRIPQEEKRHITIITYDERSAMQIRRQWGLVSVSRESAVDQGTVLRSLFYLLLFSLLITP
jgi:hypothetical protein